MLVYAHVFPYQYVLISTCMTCTADVDMYIIRVAHAYVSIINV